MTTSVRSKFTAGGLLLRVTRTSPGLEVESRWREKSERREGDHVGQLQ